MRTPRKNLDFNEVATREEPTQETITDIEETSSEAIVASLLPNTAVAKSEGEEEKDVTEEVQAAYEAETTRVKHSSRGQTNDRQ